MSLTSLLPMVAALITLQLIKNLATTSALPFGELDYRHEGLLHSANFSLNTDPGNIFNKIINRFKSTLNGLQTHRQPDFLPKSGTETISRSKRHLSLPDEAKITINDALDIPSFNDEGEYPEENGNEDALLRGKQKIPTIEPIATAGTAFSLSTIKPGSRPHSKLDSDQTVSCADNHYQTKCTNYNATKLSIAKQYNNIYYVDRLTLVNYHDERLSCVDFYNKSDGGLIWWQALRKPMKSNYKYARLYMDNTDPSCTTGKTIHFYISETALSSPKSVDWDDNWFMRTVKDPDVINICFSTLASKLPDYYAENIVYSFGYCLNHYGDGFLHDISL